MKKHQREHCLGVIKEVLRHWDPISVIDLTSKEGHDEDEYDAYATGVLSALERRKNAKGIANHLAQVRSLSIGLGNASPNEREKEIGEKLVAWRDRGYP